MHGARDRGLLPDRRLRDGRAGLAGGVDRLAVLADLLLAVPASPRCWEPEITATGRSLLLQNSKTLAEPISPDTLIVETTFVTRSGEVSVTDFMPPRGSNSHLIRIVRGVRGSVKMRMELAIRFDYGRTVPWVTRERSVLRAVAGGDMIVLRDAERRFMAKALRR